MNIPFSSDNQQILCNLLAYPPVDGSISKHEAWKQSVLLLLSDDYTIRKELQKNGFVTNSLANLCIQYTERSK